jgi:hypothetical protein
MTHRPADQCLSEQELDDYLFNRKEGAALDSIEEHVLFCTQCQSRVETEMDFVRDFRAAAIARAKARPVRMWSWTAAAGLAASAMLGFWLLREVPSSPAGPDQPVLVSLNVTRGLPLDAAAVAPAGQPVRLVARLDELPALPGYDVEVAGAGGSLILRRPVAPSGGRIELALEEPLNAGVYWVRIHGGGALLREFALRVE